MDLQKPMDFYMFSRHQMLFFWGAKRARSSGLKKAAVREGSTVPAPIGCWSWELAVPVGCSWTYSRVPGFWPTIWWSTMYIICVPDDGWILSLSLSYIIYIYYIIFVCVYVCRMYVIAQNVFGLGVSIRPNHVYRIHKFRQSVSPRG